jgi:hypothetical protein
MGQKERDKRRRGSWSRNEQRVCLEFLKIGCDNDFLLIERPLIICVKFTSLFGGSFTYSDLGLYCHWIKLKNESELLLNVD